MVWNKFVGLIFFFWGGGFYWGDKKIPSSCTNWLISKKGAVCFCCFVSGLSCTTAGTEVIFLLPLFLSLFYLFIFFSFSLNGNLDSNNTQDIITTHNFNWSGCWEEGEKRNPKFYKNFRQNHNFRSVQQLKQFLEKKKKKHKFTNSKQKKFVNNCAAKQTK